MKTKLKIFIRLFILAAFLGSILAGCYPKEPKIEFIETVRSTMLANQEIVTIDSFRVVFNPQVTGYVKVFFSDASIIETKNLNTSQVSSLLILLGSKGLKYNKTRKEFILEGGSHE